MSLLVIFVERLKAGKVEKIDLELNPSFLGKDEAELNFHKSVFVKGKAYLTDEHLIIRLDAQTKVLMPCIICNKMIDADLYVKNCYLTEDLEKISAKFDYTKALREALLLELPQRVECNGGKCKEREVIAPFLQEGEKKTFPFKDMDKNEF